MILELSLVLLAVCSVGSPVVASDFAVLADSSETSSSVSDDTTYTFSYGVAGVSSAVPSGYDTAISDNNRYYVPNWSDSGYLYDFEYSNNIFESGFVSGNAIDYTYYGYSISNHVYNELAVDFSYFQNYSTIGDTSLLGLTDWTTYPGYITRWHRLFEGNSFVRYYDITPNYRFVGDSISIKHLISNEWYEMYFGLSTKNPKHYLEDYISSGDVSIWQSSTCFVVNGDDYLVRTVSSSGYSSLGYAVAEGVHDSVVGNTLVYSRNYTTQYSLSSASTDIAVYFDVPVYGYSNVKVYIVDSYFLESTDSATSGDYLFAYSAGFPTGNTGGFSSITGTYYATSGGGSSSSSSGGGSSSESVEVVDIWSLMLNILTLPFTFMSGAFNLTLFGGTSYEVNIANLVFTLVGGLIAVFIIVKVIKMFKK